MCIKDYETEIGGQGPVRAVGLLRKKSIYTLLRIITWHSEIRFTISRSSLLTRNFFTFCENKKCLLSVVVFS
jgi:hypothetical protein